MKKHSHLETSGSLKNNSFGNNLVSISHLKTPIRSLYSRTLSPGRWEILAISTHSSVSFWFNSGAVLNLDSGPLLTTLRGLSSFAAKLLGNMGTPFSKIRFNAALTFATSSKTSATSILILVKHWDHIIFWSHQKKALSSPQAKSTQCSGCSLALQSAEDVSFMRCTQTNAFCAGNSTPKSPRSFMILRHTTPPLQDLEPNWLRLHWRLTLLHAIGSSILTTKTLVPSSKKSRISSRFSLFLSSTTRQRHTSEESVKVSYSSTITSFLWQVVFVFQRNLSACLIPALTTRM